MRICITFDAIYVSALQMMINISVKFYETVLNMKTIKSFYKMLIFTRIQKGFYHTVHFLSE